MKVFFVKNKKLGLYLSYKGNMVSTKLCGIRFNNRADATTYANAERSVSRTQDSGQVLGCARGRMKATGETVTDEQIEALRTEAGEAGDDAMVATCTAALDGDTAARRTCERAIRAARAMEGT